LLGLVVERFLGREEPAWGLDGVFEFVPGRRRGLVGSGTLLQSSDDGDDLGSLVLDGDDGLIVVLPCCGSCLVDRASGRPLVSLGSDMADWGGDGRYISKLKAMGPGEIGGSSGDADGGS
jgi:hypothetical protein